jgi:hypothetical protein
MRFQRAGISCLKVKKISWKEGVGLGQEIRVDGKRKNLFRPPSANWLHFLT